MKYLLFFTALITTATDAQRTCSCFAPMIGPDCTADKTCTVPKGQCYSIQRELDIENPILIPSKGCQEEDKDPKVCNEGVVFISTQDVFYLLSNVTCCNDKNECNKDVVVDLPDVSTINKTLSSKKLVCPSCFNWNKKTCDNAEQMNCREGQDKCFTIIGTVTKGETAPKDFAAKGCAAQSAILRNGVTLTFGSDSYKLDKVEVVEAKSGVSKISSCLSFAILLPSVLWFLLDSSLY